MKMSQSTCQNFKVGTKVIFNSKNFLRTILSIIVSTVAVSACCRNPLSKFEGVWNLDANAMLAEIVKLKLDVTADMLERIRAKLEKEKPRIRISGEKIEMTIESASTEIQYKVIEASGDCVDLLIAEKNKIRYCLDDGGKVLRTTKVVATANSIPEIYRRARWLLICPHPAIPA
jgi:hypothetical protein